MTLNLPFWCVFLLRIAEGAKLPMKVRSLARYRTTYNYSFFDANFTILLCASDLATDPPWAVMSRGIGNATTRPWAVTVASIRKGTVPDLTSVLQFNCELGINSQYAYKWCAGSGLKPKAGPSQAKKSQARPGQESGLSWLLAWPEVSESQSQRPGPRLCWVREFIWTPIIFGRISQI